MKLPILLLSFLLTGANLGGPVSSRNFSMTCTLTEKRQVTGGMLVGTKITPKQVNVHYFDGGFMFTYKGIMYSSPRLNAQGVATAPEGQQYIYSKDDQTFSVADGETYFELTKCKESN
jgi:hypothetical protein